MFTQILLIIILLNNYLVILVLILIDSCKIYDIVNSLYIGLLS
jgi:hypothetical protein